MESREEDNYSMGGSDVTIDVAWVPIIIALVVGFWIGAITASLLSWYQIKKHGN